METGIVGSNEKNKKKELLTLGNKKQFFTHVGSAVIGAAIGASISRIIPLPNPDATEEEKDADAANTPISKAGDKPKEEKPTKEKPEEEKPTEERPAEEKPAEEKPAEEESSEKKSTEEEPTEEKHTDEQEVPSQSEIDKIAEDLVKDSMIDARDAIDEGSFLHFTDYVTINLPNGLEADGYVFDIEGQDFVLADLDGDGVYDDLLAQVNGILTDVVVPIDDTTTLNKIIAENHLTESDIDQIVNGNGEIDLAMTDIERRQIENDNVEVDIARLEEPRLSENSNGDVAQLSPEEEDLLLQDLMNGKNLAEVNSDEVILIDGENEIILFDDEDGIFREDLAHHQIDQLSFPISPNATIDTGILESDMSDEISELSLDV